MGGSERDAGRGASGQGTGAQGAGQGTGPQSAGQGTGPLPQSGHGPNGRFPADRVPREGERGSGASRRSPDADGFGGTGEWSGRGVSGSRGAGDGRGTGGGRIPADQAAAPGGLRAGPAIRWMGTWPARVAIYILLAATLLGVLGTLLTGNEPGFLLGFLVLIGSVVAALGVRRSAIYVIFPLPALANFMGAVMVGAIHDRGIDTSTTELGASFLQWIANVFFAMCATTIIVLVIAGLAGCSPGNSSPASSRCPPTGARAAADRGPHRRRGDVRTATSAPATGIHGPPSIRGMAAPVPGASGWTATSATGGIPGATADHRVPASPAPAPSQAARTHPEAATSQAGRPHPGPVSSRAAGPHRAARSRRTLVIRAAASADSRRTAPPVGRGIRGMIRVPVLQEAGAPSGTSATRVIRGASAEAIAIAANPLRAEEPGGGGVRAFPMARSGAPGA